MSKIGLENLSDDDCYMIRHICHGVSRRAAFILAAGFELESIIGRCYQISGITALLKKMDCHDVTIAIGGSMFEHHHHFTNRVRSMIAQLMGDEYKFELMLGTGENLTN